MIHTSTKNLVTNACNQLGKRNHLAENQFPIVKLKLGVTGVDAHLLMDIIMSDPVVEKTVEVFVVIY